MIKKNGGVVQTVAFRQYVDIDKFNRNDRASRSLYQEVARELGLEYMEMREIRRLKGDKLEMAYDNYDKIMKAAEQRKFKINESNPPVNVVDFVNHIEYMVNLIGIDHVGISSDFDGGGGIEGWKDATETFNVTLELVRRGYTEDQIRKLWGDNLLRVLDEVQNVSAKLQNDSSLK